MKSLKANVCFDIANSWCIVLQTDRRHDFYYKHVAD